MKSLRIFRVFLFFLFFFFFYVGLRLGIKVGAWLLHTMDDLSLFLLFGFPQLQF